MSNEAQLVALREAVIEWDAAHAGAESARDASENGYNRDYPVELRGEARSAKFNAALDRERVAWERYQAVLYSASTQVSEAYMRGVRAEARLAALRTRFMRLPKVGGPGERLGYDELCTIAAELESSIEEALSVE